MELKIFSGKKYNCGKCSKVFSSELNLEKHSKNRHQMSIEQFLEALLKTPRKWSLNLDGRIIFDSDDICPLSAVAGLLFEGEPLSEAFDRQSAERMGISSSNATKIIRASDSGYVGGKRLKHENRGELRLRLLSACGIGDEEEDHSIDE